MSREIDSVAVAAVIWWTESSQQSLNGSKHVLLKIVCLSNKRIDFNAEKNEIRPAPLLIHSTRFEQRSVNLAFIFVLSLSQNEGYNITISFLF